MILFLIIVFTVMFALNMKHDLELEQVVEQLEMKCKELDALSEQMDWFIADTKERMDAHEEQLKIHTKYIKRICYAFEGPGD